MKFCIVLLTGESHAGWAHMLYYPVRLLVAGLEELGHAVNVRCNSLHERWINILVGAHHLSMTEAQALDGRYIVLQTEVVTDGQLYGRPKYSAAYCHVLANASSIWEWVDERNTYPGPTPVQLRPGHHGHLVDVHRKPREQRDIDVVFLGSVTPYRRAVLNRLTRELTVAVIVNEHWPVRNDVLARAKYMLSLRYAEGLDYFPAARVAYSLTNGIPVVAEVEPRHSAGRLGKMLEWEGSKWSGGRSLADIVRWRSEECSERSTWSYRATCRFTPQLSQVLA